MPDRLKRAAAITRLIEHLRTHGCACMEEQVHQTTCLAQTLMQTPFSYRFVYYRKTPYSFDLRDELTGFRADELIVLELEGPNTVRLATTPQATYIQDLYPRTLAALDDRLEHAARTIGALGAADGRLLATAVYLMGRDDVGDDASAKIAWLRRRDPDIDTSSAEKAFRNANSAAADTRRIGVVDTTGAD